MFDRSGEMKLSSLGLLLILTASVMALFMQPAPKAVTDAQTSAGYFNLPN